MFSTKYQLIQKKKFHDKSYLKYVTKNKYTKDTLSKK